MLAPDTKIVVGSAGGCDLLLADSTAALRAFELSSENGEVYVVNLDPLRGTLVNDEPVIEPTPIGFGDVVRAGETLVELENATTLPAPRSEVRDNVEATDHKFLAALRANPDDDATRAVYADWLEAEGFPTWAGFIRLELEGLAKIETSEIVEDAVMLTTPAWRAAICKRKLHGCSQRKCPKVWSALEEGDTPHVRPCHVCGFNVHYCASIEEVVERGDEGGVVVFDAALSQAEAEIAFSGQRTDVLDR